jgi:hypothetical protein
VRRKCPALSVAPVASNSAVSSGLPVLRPPNTGDAGLLCIEDGACNVETTLAPQVSMS